MSAGGWRGVCSFNSETLSDPTERNQSLDWNAPLNGRKKGNGVKKEEDERKRRNAKRTRETRGE